MGTSDLIASFILDIMEDAGGTADLSRTNLAERFSCVPSQINYVISTRFSPEHGYIVESRRGGGGFIRIIRLKRSAQLLQKTDLSVSEVAYRVGFNNPRYFSKYFKEEFGVLPSAFVPNKEDNRDT